MRRANIAYIRKYEIRSLAHLFFKEGTVRSIVTDLFSLPNAISSRLSFSFHLSVSTAIFIFSPICHSVYPVLYFFSLSHLQPLSRFLRHRLRSMSICIIYFVSDSSGLTWQATIFDATRSIDLTMSAKIRCKHHKKKHLTFVFGIKYGFLNLEISFANIYCTTLICFYRCVNNELRSAKCEYLCAYWNLRNFHNF